MHCLLKTNIVPNNSIYYFWNYILVNTEKIQPNIPYVFLCAFAVEPRNIEDGDVDQTIRQGKRQLCNAQEKKTKKLKKSTGW